MDWIRRNLFFNRKKKNERGSEEKDVDDYDDEFVDIVEESESSESCKSHESSESSAVPPVIQSPKKVARKPLIHQIVRLSEAAPDNTSYDPEAQAGPFVRPKTVKKKIGNNNHPQQLQHPQPQHQQLRNCIIHQPR